MEFSSASIRWSAHHCFVSSICLPRDDRGGLIVNQYRRLAPVACVAPCVFGDSRPKSLGRSELPCRRQGGIARRQGAATWRDRRQLLGGAGTLPRLRGRLPAADHLHMRPLYRMKWPFSRKRSRNHRGDSPERANERIASVWPFLGIQYSVRQCRFESLFDFSPLRRRCRQRPVGPDQVVGGNRTDRQLLRQIGIVP